MTVLRSLFRDEAQAARQASGRQGAALALSPAWIGSTYWFLVATAVGALICALVFRVGEYAHGPAVIRALDRTDLVTRTGGIVMAVDVEPGAQVRAGQALVRFHTDAELQDIAQLDREFELKLAQILLLPTDLTTRVSLASLRAQRETVIRRMREKQVIAPRAGVVRNLRIRPGQMLAPGDVVLTLVEPGESAFSVVALVPGQYRPLLKPGATLQFQLEGYPQVSSRMTVESIGNEIVGPAEIRRYLGQEVGDAIPVEGSLVLVRARLPDAQFRWRGQSYRFYDGIPGRVEVQVRRLPLFAMLFPAFEEL